MFLCSELQAAQIVRSRQASGKHKEEGPVCQELSAISGVLKLPEPRGQEVAGYFSQIQNKVGLFIQEPFVTKVNLT